MAITIVNQPTYPNATYTHLIYTVDSDQSGQPQMQYLMDVTQGGQILSRVKQYPNPQGAAVFDPARILNDYIEYDNNWTVSSESPAVSSVQNFVIYFGEEYGTSPSSSVEIYDGNGSVGAPNVTGTPTQVIGAVVDPNNGSSFNFDTSSRAMSNIPSTDNYVSYDDYNTLTVYNNGDMSSVVVNYSPGANISYTPSTGFTTIPVSTKNVGVTGQYNNITVTISYSSKADDVYTFSKPDECNYERVRFAFINNYGFYDFFGVNLPQRRVTNLTRQSLRRPNVDYSTSTSVYSATRRGTDYYNIGYSDSYTVTTDWLDQEHAEWLGEMIESPQVYLQEGNNFIPIVITNGSYVHNTNRRSQKTFQYEITYQYANQRISR